MNAKKTLAVVRCLLGLSLSGALGATGMAAPLTTADSTNPVALMQHTAPTEEALHQALRDLRDTMQQALNQRDVDELLNHVTDDVVFTTMNGDRVVGKENLRRYYHDMMDGSAAVVKSVVSKFEVEALSHLYGTDTAVAFGHSQDRYELTGGQAWTVTPQWSMTLVWQDGQWLIANFHYSVNMFDNPILNTQRQWLLGGGLVAALLAGGLGFWLGRRRKV